MSNLINKIPLVYEPKKKNRFIFRFPSDLGIQEWTVLSGSRPTITQDEVEISFLNTSTWVLGRYKWEPISITLRDPLGPSTTQAVMEWIRLHSESVTGRQGYAAAYKRNIELELLDPSGVVVEKWILVNAFLTTANFGDLGYDDNNLVTIEINVRYDYAILVY